MSENLNALRKRKSDVQQRRKAALKSDDPNVGEILDSTQRELSAIDSLIDAMKNAWQEHATELGKWAWDRMAIKRDRHGVYLPDGTAAWGFSEVQSPGYLASLHFSGKHTFGLGSTSPDDLCLFVAWDFDNHVTDVATNVNLKFAIVLVDRLKSLGFKCIVIEDSDGKGGVHVWLFFASPIPSKLAYEFAAWIARDYAQHGLDGIESFPKQASVQTTGAKCGNYLRIPGRHHKRPHWSRFYGTDDWLSIEESVKLLLSMGGDDPALIPTPPAKELKAALKKTKSAESQRYKGGSLTREGLERYISQTICVAYTLKEAGNWTTFALEAGCLFNPEHTNRGCAYFGLTDSGAVHYRCSHTGCKGIGIRDVVKKYGKPEVVVEVVAVDTKKEATTDEPKSVSPAEKTFQNYTSRFEGDSEIKDPLGMDELVIQYRKVFGRWPCMAYSRLFVPDAESGIRWIDSAAQLLSWMSESVTDPPKFCRSTGFIKEEILFETLKNRADKFEGIERFPHEPAMNGRYYVRDNWPEGNLEHLECLLNRFHPATDVDKQLILGFLMTLIWGGIKRPAFVFTADGQGAGKTTLAEVGAALVGGLMSFSISEDADKIKARLLSKVGIDKRVALIDNAKSRKLSSADLESLITCQTISGRGNHVGEAQRPNSMIWIITVNGAAFSRDMAQRSVVLRLKRPAYSGSWESDTFAYVAEHRDEILSDLIWMLRSPRTETTTHSRWAGWERDVLSRLINPEEVQRVVIERQKEIDVDRDDSDLVEEYFTAQLDDLGYGIDDHVFLPSSVAADWHNKATGEKLTVTKAVQDLRTKCESGIITKLTSHRTNEARGFLWNDTQNAASNVLQDVELRISKRTEDVRSEQLQRDQEARNSARYR